MMRKVLCCITHFFWLKNENGIFALIGNIFQPEWSESTIIRSEVIDDLDGEIDFEMMQ